MQIPKFGLEGLDLEATLDTLHWRIVLHALSMTDGNIKKTAAMLNIKRTTLMHRISNLRKRSQKIGEPGSKIFRSKSYQNILNALPNENA